MSLEAKTGNQMTLVAFREVTVVANGQRRETFLCLCQYYLSPKGDDNYNEYLILKIGIKSKCF